MLTSDTVATAAPGMPDSAIPRADMEQLGMAQGMRRRDTERSGTPADTRPRTAPRGMQGRTVRLDTLLRMPHQLMAPAVMLPALTAAGRHQQRIAARAPSPN